MQGQWEITKGQHSTGESYRIGKIIVGSCFIAITEKSKPNKYQCHIELPGLTIKSEFSKHETIESTT